MGNTTCPSLDPRIYSVILEKSLAFLGLPIDYSLIGGRTCGNAYLSNGKVYIVTTDKSEAIELNKEVGKDNKRLFNVLNVQKINTSLTNESVYLIVLEKFNIQNEELQIDEQIGQLLQTLNDNESDIVTLAKTIAKRLGFSQSNILNKGTQGFAVDVGNDTVMKITTDQSEAAEASRLIGKKNEYLADFYKIYKLNPPYDFAYVILRENLKINQADNENRIDVLYDVIEETNLPEYELEKAVSEGDYDTVVDIQNHVMEFLKNDGRRKAIMNDFFNIFFDLMKNNVNSTDFTENNFGIKKNGKFAYYDIGYSDKSKVDAADVLTLDERVMTYMKNSSAVGIKKKCMLGGNGDGTSTACNKGDIKNIELKRISEGQDKKIEYGALMLKFNITNWDKITDEIDPDDVYDKPTFGIERDPHVTILYGFHNDVKADQVKSIVEKHHDLDKKIEIKLKGISHFETPNYDVVKFDVESDELVKLNKEVKSLPHTSSFPNYHPHMTISYVKKGKGKKYDSKINKEIKLESKIIEYSTVKGTATKLNEHTSKWNKRFAKRMSEQNIIGINELPFKNDVEAAGGKIYSVGGAVRDSLLGKDSKDLDILITGIPLDKLETILSKYGKVDNVGKSFGIIKFNTPQTGEIDIAIPRTERKNDQGGYQGFDVTSDHSLPIEKDLERRDFTINAIAKDSSGLMIDPYGGQGDIEKKQIKMVNPQAFSDDPLRMLRAIQFASRFGFSIEPETLKSIQQNASKIREISPERILIEFDKIVKKGSAVTGAKLLRQSGLYNAIFGVNRGVNLSEFNNVKNMAEFIFALLHSAMQNPAEYFKNNMKGDLDTYNNLKALQIGSGFNGDKKIIFDMYKTYPASLETNMLGQDFKNTVAYMKANNIPFSLKEVPVNGNDLMQLGYSGKQIGDKFVDVLNKIYREELPNEREAILNYVKQQ